MNHSTTTVRPSARAARRAAVALVAVGLGVGTLAGCGNGVDSETGAAPTETVTATPTPTTSPSAPASSSTAAAGSPSSDGGSAQGSSAGSTASGICSAGDLRVTVEEPAGGGAAGSTYVLLSFENTSSTSCVLDGHPGVSFVGKGSGVQLGRAADFVGSVERTRIAAGAAARAQLRITSPGAYGAACAPVTPDGFRVYPPDSRASVFVKNSSFRACSKDLPGGKSQLSVTAVGTAG